MIATETDPMGEQSMLPSPTTLNPTLRARRMRPSVRPTDATPSIPGSTGALAPMPATAPAPISGPGGIATQAAQGAGTPVGGGIATQAAAAAATRPAPTPPSPATAPSPAPALPNPAGLVPTTPIDPTNDLRSAAVLPTSSPALDQARTGLTDATGALASFDRTKAIKDLMASFGSAPTDVAGGPAVGAAPSEQGTIDTLNSQVGGATGKVAGYDRNADVAAQRGDLTNFFGPTDVNAGAGVDAGKDNSANLDTADAATMAALGKVGSLDRGSLSSGLRDRLSQFLGPTDVQAGGAVSTAPSDRLGKYNTMLDDSASKLAGVDRVALAKDLLSQFDDQQLPEHDLALRKLTEGYAARGGGRSGMLRTEYGNEDLTRLRDRDAMKKALISSALEGSILDQFNKTNALSGLQASTYGQDAGIRGEQRADRGYATDVATGNVTRGLAARESAANLAGTEADATMGDASRNLAAAQGVSSDLSGRQAQRGAAQRAERAYTTDVNTGNVTRGLATKQAAQAGASAGADANYSSRLGTLAALGSTQSAAAAREAQRRAELRTERDTATGLQERNANRAIDSRNADRSFAGSVADASAGDTARRVAGSQDLFNTLAQEGANTRAETRGERAYQGGLEADSYGRAVTQQQLEQQQQAQELAQTLAQLSAGEQGNPSNVLATLANGSGLDANAIAQLAATLGQKSAKPATTTTIPGTNLPLPEGIDLSGLAGLFS